MVYCDYPIHNFKSSPYKSASFKVIGDARFNCRMLILSDTKIRPGNFTVTVGTGKNEKEIKLLQTSDKQLEYAIPGDSKVTVRWK